MKAMAEGASQVSTLMSKRVEATNSMYVQV